MGKKMILFLMGCMMIVGFVSCYTSGPRHRNMPPGQAKKVYRTKSAKPFAPGQQKKNKAKPGRKDQNLFPTKR